MLRRKRRTQKGRAESEERDIKPIERPKDIAGLLEALTARPAITRKGDRARFFDPIAARELHLYALLMLDAGLRSGEAMGVRWRNVLWG